MVMVDLAAEQPLHGVDDPAAADERAVDVVVQRVADGEPDDAALAVAAAGGLLLELVVGPGDPAEQPDLLGVEEPLDDQVAVAPVTGESAPR